MSAEHLCNKSAAQWVFSQERRRISSTQPRDAPAVCLRRQPSQRRSCWRRSGARWSRTCPACWACSSSCSSATRCAGPRSPTRCTGARVQRTRLPARLQEVAYGKPGFRFCPTERRHAGRNRSPPVCWLCNSHAPPLGGTAGRTGVVIAACQHILQQVLCTCARAPLADATLHRPRPLSPRQSCACRQRKWQTYAPSLSYMMTRFGAGSMRS